MNARNLVDKIYIDEKIVEYILDLVIATRPGCRAELSSRQSGAKLDELDGLVRLRALRRSASTALALPPAGRRCWPARLRAAAGCEGDRARRAASPDCALLRGGSGKHRHRRGDPAPSGRTAHALGRTLTVLRSCKFSRGEEVTYAAA